MFKNKFSLMLLVALLVMALTACGDATSTATPANSVGDTSGLPVLSGATSIALPDALKQQGIGYANAVKNGSFTAYKSSDQPSKVESALTDLFKKAGWEDKSAIYASAASALKSQGIFMLTFQKGTSIASAIGYPGSVATALGASVGSNETFYMVVSGNS
ncbi:MAG: hypothetical protein WCS37_21075 [Chloroflexota bacterium]|nr:hypothetical protein [Chloroflexota bacterium]